MSTKSSAAKPEAAAPGGPSHGVRSVVSLIVFLHLFCVFVALSTNNSPSNLALSFLRIMRGYTQALNFEPFVPYHLTLAEPIDVDHTVEVLPTGANENDPAGWLALPDTGIRGGERRHRYERLGEHMDIFVEQEREDNVALLAATIGEHFLHQRQAKPKQIRCRRHSLVSWDTYGADGTPEMRDPSSPTYFSVVYAANAVVDEDTGTVEVVKIEGTGEVARPTGSP